MGSMGSAEPTKYLYPIVEPVDFERFRLEYANGEPIPKEAPAFA